MFEVGFSELLIIGFVALLVLGPERLPRAARFAGLWIRRARAQWYSVRSELERELAAEDMKRALGEPLAQMRPQVERLGADIRREFSGLDPGLPARLNLGAPDPESGLAPGEASLAEQVQATATQDGVEMSRADDASVESVESAAVSERVDARSDELADESGPVTGDLFGPVPPRTRDP